MRAPLLLAFAAVGPALGGVLAAAPCAGFEVVPGVGPACPEDGGWRVLLGDGATVWTHGADLLPTDLAVGPSTGFAPQVAPACVHDPAVEHHVQIVYARPADAPDPLGARVREIRAMVHELTGKLVQESSPFGVALRPRVRCTDGVVDVAEVVLPVPSLTADFQSVSTGVRAAGYTLPHVKYWIWWNGGNRQAAGVATLVRDDSPSPFNGNNVGPTYAVTFGVRGWGGAYVMLHEGGHTLGAVQNSAPHSTGSGHCNDGHDVMCYDDGGPSARWFAACASLAWDCRKDTYFHPSPPAGSWLATHWNLGSPVVRYLEGCSYHTGRLVTGAAGRDVEGATHALVDVPAACEGRPYALTHPNQDNFDVCWLGADGADLACDRQVGVATFGVVPAGAVAARVEYPRLAAGQWHLSVV